MISPDTRFRMARVPLSQIVVREYQPRHPDRALHYHQLLTDTAHVADECGPVAITPAWDDEHHQFSATRFALLDGHHRYVAHILAGRPTLLALVEYDPGQPGYETAYPVDTLCE